MLHFSEDFVDGFLGFGRTYGAVARFECRSVIELEADWPMALRKTIEWRAKRNERATTLHLYVLVPPAVAEEAAAFIVPRVVVPRAAMPQEFRGLKLEVAVVGEPDMAQYLDVTLYWEAREAPVPL